MPLFSNVPRRRTIFIVAAAVVVCAAIIVACVLAFGRAPAASAPSPSPSVTATPEAAPTAAPEAVEEPMAPVIAPAASTVAAVLGTEVPVSAEPGGAVALTLPNPQASGAPLVFLVVAQQGDWVQVQLAQRPNGSTGWVPASAVALSTTPYALVVTTATNTLDLYQDGALPAELLRRHRYRGHSDAEGELRRHRTARPDE